MTSSRISQESNTTWIIGEFVTQPMLMTSQTSFTVSQVGLSQGAGQKISCLIRSPEHSKPIPRILHYTGEEPYTKYEMCLVFAKLLGLPHGHIIPQADVPKDVTTRPYDCHLDVRETEALGLEGGLNQSLFEEWWSQHLK